MSTNFQELRIEILFYILPKSPFEFFVCCSTGCHIDGEKKLLEVNVPVLVGVECSEDVITELPRVTGWETLAVNLAEVRGTLNWHQLMYYLMHFHHKELMFIET